MARLGVDLNSGGAVPDGTYLATLTGAKFKIKVGEKFNNVGTKEVDGNTFANHPTEKPDAEGNIKAQSKITFELKTDKGNVWHDVFMSSKAMFMVKAAFDALAIPYNKEDGSFDTDDVMGAIGNRCMIDVIINEGGFNEITGIKAA